MARSASLLASSSSSRFLSSLRFSLALATVCVTASSASASAVGTVLPHPILFVTQVPIPADFTTIGSTFGNHLSTMQSAGRGGDLWIRYADGTLRNLTEAAGYGTSGFQDDSAIAVREPSVHWDGNKALFSMVIGAPEQYVWEDYFWQIYEIENFAPGETPVISRVLNQPANFNNVSPIYGTDDRILFTSDRPRDGQAHLYPQLDEYETAPTVSGVWSLDPTSGDLFLLDHAPSGAFSLELDSFGRVLFTRWDHLQRDQQADADEVYGDTYGTFNWTSESIDSVPVDSREEFFPEPRPFRTDLLDGTNLVGHTFNHFFPWMMEEDGRTLETLGHVGRHELHTYFARSLNDDSNLQDFTGNYDDRILNFFHIAESPTEPGIYYGIDAPEFYTHSSGQVIRFAAAPTDDPEQFAIEYVTDRSTANTSDSPPPEHSGLYRNPIVLADGTLVAVHTPETRQDYNPGTRANPSSLYDLRMKTLQSVGSVWEADTPLTPGIHKTVSYYDPDVLVTYSGELWELDPVEVKARPRPTASVAGVEAPEAQIFAEEGVSIAEMEAYLEAEDLALVVSRDITTRDDIDEQQPFNLRVPGGTQTIGASGTVYELTSLQFFEGEQLRGIGGMDSPRPGRRVLAQPLDSVVNPPNPGGPLGSVGVAEDGSIAAFVPARRALTWQSTSPTGEPVVRERYWLTFQPGEIRACGSCHGLNDRDQAGNEAPENPPEALRELLQFYKETVASVDPAEHATAALTPTFSPNPFRESTTVQWTLDSAVVDASLEVFDAAGRRRGAVSLGSLSAGEQRLAWDGRVNDLDGESTLGAGVYFLRVQGTAGDREVLSRATRVTLLR